MDVITGWVLLKQFRVLHKETGQITPDNTQKKEELRVGGSVEQNLPTWMCPYAN